MPSKKTCVSVQIKGTHRHSFGKNNLRTNHDFQYFIFTSLEVKIYGRYVPFKPTLTHMIPKRKFHF